MDGDERVQPRARPAPDEQLLVVERLEIPLNAQRGGSDYRIQLLPLPPLEPDDGVEDVPVEPEADVVPDPLGAAEELVAVGSVGELVTVTVPGELLVGSALLVPVPVGSEPLAPVPAVVPATPVASPVAGVEPASGGTVVETLVDPGPPEDAPPLVTVPAPIELPPVAGVVEVADDAGLVAVAAGVLPARVIGTTAPPCNEVDPLWAAVPADG